MDWKYEGFGQGKW